MDERRLRNPVKNDELPLGDKWVGQFVLADKKGDPVYDDIVAKHVV